jgi:hypothetical protein
VLHNKRLSVYFQIHIISSKSTVGFQIPSNKTCYSEYSLKLYNQILILIEISHDKSEAMKNTNV